MKKLLYILNWKLYRTYQESLIWCNHYKNELIHLSSFSQLVICPQFIDLASLHEIFKETSLELGAQNCAPYEKGGYTGEVSVLSLKQVGCRYCIIGHYERRSLFNETNDNLIKKITLLLSHSLIPILCIGETLQEKEDQKTFNTLEEQCNILQKISWESFNSPQCIIAYEPVWAIGSNQNIHYQDFEKILEWIKKYTSQLSYGTFKILYGGNVNATNSTSFKTIPFLDGFLIGRASLDFQELKKIVL